LKSVTKPKTYSSKARFRKVLSFLNNFSMIPERRSQLTKKELGMSY
jgi:hypothetical protein